VSQAVVLILILSLGFLIKVPALHHPLVGYFGSYQVVNGMMAHMMDWHSPSSLVIPTTFLIINGKPALHLLYYPFASLFASGFHVFIGGAIDFWGRFQAAFFMTLSSLVVYVISVKLFNRKVALIAAALFTFSPMVLLTGMSFQNEAIGMFFLLASYWILISGSSTISGFTAGLLFSLALTARIHFFVSAPAFLFTCYGSRDFKKLFSFILGMVLPLGAWLAFTYHLSQISDHVLTSSFEQASEGRILSLQVFSQTKFYQRVLEIMAGEWLTPVLFPFLFLSLFSWNSKKLPLVLWVLGTLGLFILVPEKVANHSFYLICGVPAACILIAAFLDHISIHLNRLSWAAFFSLFFLFSLRYYLSPMLSPRRSDFKQIPELGRQIQTLIGPDQWIIASYGSSPELLYYSERLGWPFGVEMNLTPSEAIPLRHKEAREAGYGKPIEWLEHLRREGAKYLVIGEPEAFRKRVEFYDYVRKHYQEMPNGGSQLIIFDVSKQIT